MILQMNTMNKKSFLAELEKCCGSVLALLPDGSWGNAGTAVAAHKADRYTPIRLTLDIRQPGDYMRLACFAIGDV